MTAGGWRSTAGGTSWQLRGSLSIFLSCSEITIGEGEDQINVHKSTTKIKRCSVES